MHNIKTLKNELILQKELYIATIIHDLKNPLQAQICSIKLLKEEHFGKISEIQKEILNTILESCTFMQSLLFSVLDTYKIENGLIKINPGPIDINKMLQLCINEIKNFSENNNIKIKYVNFSKRPEIFADYNLIRRVITNLLNNAVNYSFKNTVLFVTCKENKNNFLIKIKNTGYEIPKDIKEHIFDKYTTGNTTNAGLGLYLCKKVIEAHNGVISLFCKDNSNEFVINLPKDTQSKEILKFV